MQEGAHLYTGIRPERVLKFAAETFCVVQWRDCENGISGAAEVDRAESIRASRWAQL